MQFVGRKKEHLPRLVPKQGEFQLLRKLTLTVALLLALGSAMGNSANAKLRQDRINFWINVGQCEQPGAGAFGVNWSMPGPTYQGGLGFYSTTWKMWASELKPGGRTVYERFPNAGLAPMRVQIWVAEHGLTTDGNGWGCI